MSSAAAAAAATAAKMSSAAAKSIGVNEGSGNGTKYEPQVAREAPPKDYVEFETGHEASNLGGYVSSTGPGLLNGSATCPSSLADEQNIVLDHLGQVLDQIVSSFTSDRRRLSVTMTNVCNHLMQQDGLMVLTAVRDNPVTTEASERVIHTVVPWIWGS
eukprot:GHVT01001779.1.p1 GENE.GHVT01001779.1~~GHVT01001779.1.p1  ORF type:complete len:159 (+),score=35.95 GHVT01001779.1:1311-1787(+)